MGTLPSACLCSSKGVLWPHVIFCLPKGSCHQNCLPPDNAQIRVLSLCYLCLFLIKMYLSPVHSLKFLVYKLIKYFMVRFK